jgi:C1A family cysteine protease
VIIALIIGIALDTIHKSYLEHLAHIKELAELSMIQLAEHLASEHGHVEKGSRETSHLASTLDWRGTGVLPPVRNQGDFGTCYAMATCYSIECLILKVMGLKIQLSPQELIDCGGFENIYNAYKYIMANEIGIECDLPYVGKKSSSCGVDKRKKRFYIDNYGYIPFKAHDESYLMEALYKQPITVTLAVGEDFGRYKRGVYDSYDRSSKNYHAMLLVGYGMFEGKKGVDSSKFIW